MYHSQQISLLLLIVFAATISAQNTQVSWATSKDIELEFDDEFLRVGSRYSSFSFATGNPTDTAQASPSPELHPISSAFTSGVAATDVTSFDASASAVATWQAFKDNGEQTTNIVNSVGGAASIITDQPDLVAVSWATQSSSVDLGVFDNNGSIDWQPAVAVGTGGGGLVNATGAYQITDPIVVWTTDTMTGDATAHTVFEFTAEFDQSTSMNWNDVAIVDQETDQVVLLQNDGPFLDASAGGTGSFALSVGSELVPVNQRGSIQISFADGLITESLATGVFESLNPGQGDPPDGGEMQSRLPVIGMPAIIGSLNIDNDLNLDGRIQLDINTIAPDAISDVTACSEGLEMTVGLGVDSVQTFTLDPMARSAQSVDTSHPTPAEREPRPCFGSIPADSMDFLFGSELSPTSNVTLIAEQSDSIDRFLRLDLALEQAHKTVILDRGTNDSPADTRSWTGRARVRATDEPNTGFQIFAIGLVDVAAHGDTSDDFTLFSGQTEAITFSVGETPGELSAQLFIDGERQTEADVQIEQQVLNIDAWNDVAVSVEERNGGTRFVMQVLNGDTTTTILDTTVDDFQLSDAGYRLAVGSRTIDSAGGHDFDNLVLSFQQQGDVEYNAAIDGADVSALLTAVSDNLTDPIFDTNLDGSVDEADIILVEDLVPNRLPGDANFDGVVNFPDFLALSEAFGQDTGLWSRGDFDRNGNVGFPDFLILADNFGAVQNAVSVPEPVWNVLHFAVWLGVLTQIRSRNATLAVRKVA